MAGFDALQNGRCLVRAAVVQYNQSAAVADRSDNRMPFLNYLFYYPRFVVGRHDNIEFIHDHPVFIRLKIHYGMCSIFLSDGSTVRPVNSAIRTS